MTERTSVRERIIEAVNAGMKHIDSISIYADSSEAYVRVLCNRMAKEDHPVIIKEKGRAHDTYLPSPDN